MIDGERERRGDRRGRTRALILEGGEGAHGWDPERLATEAVWCFPWLGFVDVSFTEKSLAEVR